jgi:putative ABC transport system substrate-binding protein
VRRREVLALLGSTALARPLCASAQTVRRERRVGVLVGIVESTRDPEARVAAFEKALSTAGWSPGTNIKIEYRFTSAGFTELRRQAAELAAWAPEVIVAQGTPVLQIARQTLRDAPTVFVQVADPVGQGIVDSLAKPGGVVTGFTNFELSMGGKWLDLLQDIAPATARVGILTNPENPATAQFARAIEAAAQGVSVITAPVRDDRDVESAIATIAEQPPAGLIVTADGIMLGHRQAIIAAAARHKVPAIYPFRSFVESGGLMAYGLDLPDLYRRAAGYVDRILKGAKPGDLPIEAPTKFDLVINARTAKALGLQVPASVLARADDVID